VGESAMKTQNNLGSFARELRKNCTNAERQLWRYLRNSQLEGIKFRRQQQIESYIVDFVSFEAKIVIELDGEQHALNGQYQYDVQRDACLQRNGFLVLRFWNYEVFNNIDGVLEAIREALPGIPRPLSPGGRGLG
jgi:very-short-patch-repair endonuclease